MSTFKFKNTGLKISDYYRREDSKEKINSNDNRIPLSVKLPLEKGYRNNETLFKMNFSIEEQIENDLKVFLMTRKGEKIGFPNFGTNLIDLYNLGHVENLEERAMEEIESAVSTYFPSVNLNNFKSEFKETYNEESFYELTIEYNISGFNILNSEMIVKIKTSR